jgi:hypothetical protein
MVAMASGKCDQESFFADAAEPSETGRSATVTRNHCRWSRYADTGVGACGSERT